MARDPTEEAPLYAWPLIALLPRAGLLLLPAVTFLSPGNPHHLCLGGLSADGPQPLGSRGGTCMLGKKWLAVTAPGVASCQTPAPVGLSLKSLLPHLASESIL